MKKFILLIFILSPFISMSQRDTLLYKAGKEFIAYQKQHTAGTVLQIGGSALLAVGAAANNTAQKPVIIGGAVLAFIGFIIQLTATNHIKNAGVYLMGNKVIVPIHNKL